MNVQLRPMNSDDVSVAMHLKDGAGWNQTESDWRRLITASPDGCFVAVGPGSVVGTVTTITYEGRVSWVGMVLVDPRYRAMALEPRYSNAQSLISMREVWARSSSMRLRQGSRSTRS